MEQQRDAALTRQPGSWIPVAQEPDHPLSPLDGEELAGNLLWVLLGPTSRFGARYFAIFLNDTDGRPSREPVLNGLHNSGPLPSYNWIEVAETYDRVTLPDGSQVDIGDAELEHLFALLLRLLPLGGHLMVEYDSPQRAETARALALGVPALATPLGEMLFRVGFGAHFKDWQIAEGGREGPRKLQAYKSPSLEDTRRWEQGAARQLEAFLQEPAPASDLVRTARERAAALLPLLVSEEPKSLPHP